MDYKKRIKKSFDYENIKAATTKAMNARFSERSYMYLLWTPRIFFTGYTWSSANYPFEKYYDILTSTNGVCCLEFYTKKSLFGGKKEFFGKIYPEFVDEEERWKPVIEYFKSKANCRTEDDYGYFKFSTYDELEDYLKGLETVINESCDGYVYFDEKEAEENSDIKRDMFLLVAYENELVEFDHKIRMAKETQDRRQINLEEMIEDLKKKINGIKANLAMLRQSE
jgi:hypothetical protein